MRLALSLAAAAATAALVATAAIPAQASAPFYSEWGLGASEILFGSSLLGSGTPDRMGLGYALYPAFFYDLQGGTSEPLHFHIGLNSRFSQGTANGSTTMIMTPYPAVRVELKDFIFAGAGASPFVWTSNGSFLHYNRAIATTAFMAEAGVEHPLIPSFYLVLSADMQVFSTPGGLGPKPAVDICGALRFYIGHDSGGSSSSSRHPWEDSYDGWRYPFGEERR